MYNCIKDTYTCDLCGFEMEWDASDLVHGEMWGCERKMRRHILLQVFHRPAWAKRVHEDDAGQ